MAQNKIKIKTNPENNTLSFFILSEQQKWCPVSNSSALSRKKFVNANIKDISAEIIESIDSVYNMRSRGVDIYFEGSNEDYSVLQNTINTLFADKNIKSFLQKTVIAVAGKVQSGKTTLIEAMARSKGEEYQLDDTVEIPTYSNVNGTVVWYEIPGIDIGIENLIAARETFERLAKSGITTFIYCLSSTKIELLEEEFINFVTNNYSSVKVILALTKYTDEEEAIYSNQLSNRMKGVKVIPLLAKDLKTRQGTIEAYGLDILDQAIFEGR